MATNKVLAAEGAQRGAKPERAQKRLFVHDCGSKNVMKTHLTLCFQAWNADASHTQNLAKLARLRRPRDLTSNVDHIAFNLGRGLRRSYVSPRLCKRASLFIRDALPFNRLMRNFKRNSSCYGQQWRNLDRIELRRRGALQNENSKAPRRSRADSVETLRTSKTSAFNRFLTHTYARTRPKEKRGKMHPHLAASVSRCFFVRVRSERESASRLPILYDNV